MPIISIIMPTYNSEKYLRESIDSILGQTFIDFELVIIDDNSSDGTLEIINSIDDSRIKIVQGDCKGIAAALNKGIMASRGKYIARMDSDDVALPERIEKQLDFLEKNPEYGVCGTLVREFDGKTMGKIWREDEIADSEYPGIITQLIHSPAVCHPSVMFRRDLFDKYSLRYNEKMKHAEDQELWINALQYVRFYNIQEVLLLYRLHKDNSSIVTINEGDKTVVKLKINLLKKLYPHGSYNENELNLQMTLLDEILNKRGVWDRVQQEISKNNPNMKEIIMSIKNWVMMKIRK